MAARRKRRPRIPNRAARQRASAKVPRVLELRLAVAVRKLLTRWVKEVSKEIEKLDELKLDADRWTPGKLDRIEKAAEKTAARLAKDSRFAKEFDDVTRKLSASNAIQLEKMGVPLRLKGDRLDKLVTGWRKEGVESIQGLMTSEAGRLRNILTATESTSLESIAAKIEDRMGVTIEKARLWARTETARINANITEERHKAAGITEYVWTTAGDERVSDAHAELDGQTFSYDDPPTDSDGNTGNPGDIRPNCRCTAYPVLAF